MSERWVVLPEGAPTETQAAFAQILAVHAALLHTGRDVGRRKKLDGSTLCYFRGRLWI
jgi:hypothetical protein